MVLDRGKYRYSERGVERGRRRKRKRGEHRARQELTRDRWHAEDREGNKVWDEVRTKEGGKKDKDRNFS